ncbi:MAG: flagellar export protein FliJ [Capsulimonadaceae bacterium]|nr:flagellar export protein FliJ [Capsulimonadaceae bacterium]
MKRFKFRLQTVLEQRERIETHAKRSYGEAQRALVQGQKLLEQLEEARAAILQEFTEIRLAGHFSPEEARAYQDYIQSITLCVHEQFDSVRQLQSTAEAFRLNLVGASQNRRIVDKLKERDHESHVMLANKVEQTENDELASTRFSYKRTNDDRAA